MKYKRSSGILLHPTSLPGPNGIGDLGPEAYHWLQFLKDSGCSLWQVLPLGPTGYGDSPYQCFSAFAGNPYLISPTLLLDQGLLDRPDLADRPHFPEHQVNYGEVIQWKLTLLDRAYAHFNQHADASLKQAYQEFQSSEKEWLDDFSTFMAIKETYGGVAWNNWPKPLRTRESSALAKFRQENFELIQRHIFRQFLFFQQWNELHKFARQNGLTIVGDVPIFIAYDSADAWSNPELFYISEDGQPQFVAGVPPDYFSRTGQLWGNPLYRWDVHKNTGFSWWIKRMRSALQLFDVIRLDHFRGFAGYWEVPAGNPTAEFGRWVPGPGADLFNAINQAFGDLPIIAEDLGEITPDVIQLREKFHLPGMKIFQFAFSADPTDPFLPQNYSQNCVAYTGTHDNDTALGWYKSAPEIERKFCLRYLNRNGDDISWDMIRAVWSSVAVMTLAPLQDFLKMDTDARMNYPGRPSGNWGYRFTSSAFTDELKQKIYEINYLYARLPDNKIKPDKILK
jgi:4-alpha-glucanotransferase